MSEPVNSVIEHYGNEKMGTRSATIIRQTTYWGETPDTEELMRFYRHCDGYPDGHGLEMALAIVVANQRGYNNSSQWLARFLMWYLIINPSTSHIEFEPYGCQHGDLEYLYVVEGTVDRRWSETKDGKLHITISVYNIGLDESYYDAEKREPIFSGTAYEYVEKFGKEEDK